MARQKTSPFEDVVETATKHPWWLSALLALISYLYHHALTSRPLLVVSILAMTSFGCSTSSHFSKLPTPDEFSKPLQQLKQEYPDLAKYESFPFPSTIFSMPEAEPLKVAWGEPNRTGFTAWMLLPTSWVSPYNYWYWDFEDKTVAALIHRPLVFSLRPHVYEIKIEEILGR